MSVCLHQCLSLSLLLSHFLSISQTNPSLCTNTSSTHTSVQQLSHWHTRQPITGSVEDGCHGSTSRAMLPHDQRCDAAEPASFLCSTLLPLCCCIGTQLGTDQIQMSTYFPRTFCYLIENRATVLYRAIETNEPFCFVRPFVYFHSMWSICTSYDGTMPCSVSSVKLWTACGAAMRCNKFTRWITHER